MISVIVPIYNTAQYLPRCIDSVLNQTYYDFELLLIDDGSTDDSSTICDQYAQHDSRISIFHKENGGVSDTRNFGLDRAKGDYITFVDSDDYIGQDYLKILMEMADEYDSDITILSFKIVYSENLIFEESIDQRTTYTGIELFREFVKGDVFDTQICAKLFKAHLFDTVRFPIGKTYEDLGTIPYIAIDCRRGTFSTSIQYYYYQRSGSITHTSAESNMRNWIYEIEKLLDFTAKEDPETYPYAVSRMVKALFWAVIDWHLFSQDYEVVALRCRRRITSYTKNVPSLPGLNRKDRIKLTIFMRNIKLYRFVRVLWIRYSRDPGNKRFLSK